MSCIPSTILPILAPTESVHTHYPFSEPSRKLELNPNTVNTRSIGVQTDNHDNKKIISSKKTNKYHRRSPKNI